MPVLIDLAGREFGPLTVLRRTADNARKKTYWDVLCGLCGCEKSMRADTIKDSTSKACGCLRDAHKTTHGLTKSAEYKTWDGLKARCYRSRDPSYHYYGARGIQVCERWRSSFENFLSDMGNRPDGMTIDRIDVNGDYSRTNCRWATPEQQANNRRNNVIIEVDGEPMTISQAARLLKLPDHAVRSHPERYGVLLAARPSQLNQQLD